MRSKNGGDGGTGFYVREGTTSRVTAADRTYSKFYDFYSVSPENFGSTHVSRHLVAVHFSNLTKKVLALLVWIIACSGIHCGLKYQHWPRKRKIFRDQKDFSGVLYRYNSDKVMLKNRRYPQKSMFTAAVWPTETLFVELG